MWVGLVGRVGGWVRPRHQAHRDPRVGSFMSSRLERHVHSQVLVGGRRRETADTAYSTLCTADMPAPTLISSAHGPALVSAHETCRCLYTVAPWWWWPSYSHHAEQKRKMLLHFTYLVNSFRQMKNRLLLILIKNCVVYLCLRSSPKITQWTRYQMMFVTYFLRAKYEWDSKKAILLILVLIFVWIAQKAW